MTGEEYHKYVIIFTRLALMAKEELAERRVRCPTNCEIRIHSFIARAIC
jgi:hypothetical protein